MSDGILWRFGRNRTSSAICAAIRDGLAYHRKLKDIDASVVVLNVEDQPGMPAEVDGVSLRFGRETLAGHCWLGRESAE